MTDTESDRQIDLNTASEYLNVRPAAIRKRIRKGKDIPAHKAGKRWMFRISELDEWAKRDGNGILLKEESDSKNAIVKACRKTAFFGYYLYALLTVPIVYGRAFRRGALSYLSEEDFRVWKKAMLRMLKEYCFAGYNFRVRIILRTFARSEIEVVRKSEPCSPDDPIVILCVKNDLRRIRMLLDFYRSLGVGKMAILDNGSSDGTFEWLKEQPDVDLFRCREPYRTAVKEGWINRLVSHYGFDRWYILTDSDELCAYIGMENHPLTDVISFANRNGIRRFKGLTIDMYPNGPLYEKTDDLRQDFRWMDYNTYYEREQRAGRTRYCAFWGGPKYRLMNTTITLSKWPLVFWEKGTVSDSAHFQFPHDTLPASECGFGILHYKFTDSDLAVYKARAQNGSGFSSNGLWYKHYVDFMKEASPAGFAFEDSVEFIGSESLRRISLISDLKLDESVPPCGWQ